MICGAIANAVIIIITSGPPVSKAKPLQKLLILMHNGPCIHESYSKAHTLNQCMCFVYDSHIYIYIYAFISYSVVHYDT